MDDARGPLDQAGTLTEEGGAGIAAVFQVISEDEGQAEGIGEAAGGKDSVDELREHGVSLVVVGMGLAAAQPPQDATEPARQAAGRGRGGGNGRRAVMRKGKAPATREG